MSEPRFNVENQKIDPLTIHKADSFQSDIFPPALAPEPALSAGEFFAGKSAAPILVSLENGQQVSGMQAAFDAAALRAPTKTVTAPAPAPAPAPVPVTPVTAPPPASRMDSLFTASPLTDEPPPVPAQSPSKDDVRFYLLFQQSSVFLLISPSERDLGSPRRKCASDGRTTRSA